MDTLHEDLLLVQQKDDAKFWWSLLNSFLLEAVISIWLFEVPWHLQKLAVLANVHFVDLPWWEDVYFKTCWKITRKYVRISEKSNLTRFSGKDCIPPSLCPIRSGYQEYDNLTTKLGRKQLEEAFAHVNIWSSRINMIFKSRGFLQMRCLREYMNVIEDGDTSRVILVNLVYPCVPSGQDIYAMLDLDMPLSEAALRTRWGKGSSYQIWFFQVNMAAFLGHGKSQCFCCKQFFQAQLTVDSGNQEMILINVASIKTLLWNFGSAKVCYIRHQSVCATKIHTFKIQSFSHV